LGTQKVFKKKITKRYRKGVMKEGGGRFIRKAAFRGMPHRNWNTSTGQWDKASAKKIKPQREHEGEAVLDETAQRYKAQKTKSHTGTCI